MNVPKIGLYGAGNMAQAIIRGLIGTGYPANAIYAYRRRRSMLACLTRQTGVTVCESPEDMLRACQIIVLGVKPWQMTEVCRQIARQLPATTTIVSLAAGITHQTIASQLPEHWIVRVMPNTPVAVASGVCALYSPDAEHGQTKQVQAVFSRLGFAFHLKEENQLHAVTALSGSGPAYCFDIMAHMQTIGTDLGLDSDTARSLAVYTLTGAGLLAQQQQSALTVLRDQVVSKGGTTEAALDAFHRLGLGTALQAGLRACYQRSKELSRQD